MQIKILNLTRHPLSKAQLEAALATTLNKIEPMYRRDVARNLSVREVRVEIKSTPAATLDSARVAWETDAIIPWIDVRMPGARAMYEAVNARLGFDLTRGGGCDWSCGVTAGAKWWMIHGWDDAERIMEGERE